METKSFLKPELLTAKKNWHKPTIEIIAKNIIKSGTYLPAPEGVATYIYGDLYYGLS
jgi:hypothetical protein